MRRLAALLVIMALAGCGAGDGLPGPPDQLPGLLRLAPAGAVDRGLFLDMGSVLPIDGSLGFQADQIEVLLESGAPPLTVLLGAFDPDVVADAADRWGYRRADVDRWTVHVREQGAAPDAPPLVTSVPALGVRGRLLVLGSEREVRQALTDPQPPEWVDRAARALGPGATQAAFAPAVRIEEHARRLGADPADLLTRHGARAPLGDYLGFSVSRDGADDGVIAVVFPPGEGGPQEASALAQRVATTSVLGEPGRRLADDFEPGGPRWVEAASTVRLPVAWQRFDAARMRADVEGRVLLPLVPHPE